MVRRLTDPPARVVGPKTAADPDEGDVTKEVATDGLPPSEPIRVAPVIEHSLIQQCEAALQAAPAGTKDSLDARRRLAELLAEREPWQASLHARTVLAANPDDDGAWAVLALAQAILGQHRYAVQAYRRAATLSPNNPWYAHNLGHLLDVALNAPEQGVECLERAHRAVPDDRAIRSSLAHALGRVGRIDEARALLVGGRTIEERSLLAWLDAMKDDVFVPRALVHRKTDATDVVDGTSSNRPQVEGKVLRGVVRLLRQGLASLPLTPRQRRRALLLLREPIAQALASEGEASLAAAIGYAIVYVEQIPLTANEVAATFRVPSGNLRSRFHILQRELGLRPGDARFIRRG